MRLTHYTKVDYPKHDRASLQISIHHSEHPDEIPIRLSQEGIAEPLWLTWEEFDAASDLVANHRAVALTDPPYCGARDPEVDLPCLVVRGLIHSAHVDQRGVTWGDSTC